MNTIGNDLMPNFVVWGRYCWLWDFPSDCSAPCIDRDFRKENKNIQGIVISWKWFICLQPKTSYTVHHYFNIHVTPSFWRTSNIHRSGSLCFFNVFIVPVASSDRCYDGCHGKAGIPSKYHRNRNTYLERVYYMMKDTYLIKRKMTNFC